VYQAENAGPLLRARGSRTSATALRSRIPRNVLLLGLVSLLTDVSSEMVSTILPIYAVVVLGASPLAYLGLQRSLELDTTLFPLLFVGSVVAFMVLAVPMGRLRTGSVARAWSCAATPRCRSSTGCCSFGLLWTAVGLQSAALVILLLLLVVLGGAAASVGRDLRSVGDARA
jgi:hypothetical protein